MYAALIAPLLVASASVPHGPETPRIADWLRAMDVRPISPWTDKLRQ